MLSTVALLAACSASGPQAVGAQPSWRQGSGTTEQLRPVGPVTFAPTTEPATRYNEPLQAPPKTPLGDAVIEAVTAAAKRDGRRVPVADARMFRACSELAAIVPEEGVLGYSFEEFALQRNGIIEPSPHLLVVWGDIDSPQVIVDQLAPRLGEILADGADARLGIGVAKRNADGSGAVVFALQGSGITTAPIPRSVAAGGSFALDAVVDARYHDPEVFVTRDDGTTQRVELKAGASGGFTSQVACGAHHGKQQIEVTASDASGSTVLANFPVWCGTQPPVTLTVEPSRDDGPVTDAADGEKRLFALVNRDRQAAGLAALTWDPAIAAVARAHSDEMHRTKIVSHISATTGSAADRVHAAKIKTPLVLENVARAYGVGEAHDGLMNSPGHRANIMSRVATNLGVGVVLGDDVSGRREIFITQVFTRVPPTVDPAKVAATIATRITAVRPVTSNPKLDAIARDVALGLAAGKSRDQLWPTVKPRIDALGNLYGKVGSVVTAVSELDSIDGKELIGSYKPDEIGVGVAQGPHPEIGDNAIWLVVLLAEKR